MITRSAPWRPSGRSASDLGVVLLVLLPALAAAGDPTAAGRDTGQAALDKYRGQAAFNTNIAQPITQAATPLTTVDNSASGSGQITAPSSKAFVQVAVQPGATGDLAQVRVFEDLDLNGQFEYSALLPHPVSGVCANGVISCTPGTWLDCAALGWTANAAGQATLAAVSIDELGGCYCINASCGSNLVWNNLALVLKDLGGGVVGAVQQSRPSFIVTDVATDDAAITYYGMDTGRAGADQAGVPLTGTVGQVQYYHAPGQLSGAAESERLSQSADPGSYYAAVATSLQNRQEPGALATCDIRRQVTLFKPTINDVIVPQGGTGAVQICGADCIDVILGRVGDNYWSGRCAIFEEDFRVFVKLPELIQSATIVRAKWDDYMQVWIDGDKVWSGPNSNFPPETAGACELSTSWDHNPNQDVTAYFQRHGEIQTKIRVSVTGGGEGFAYVRIRLKPLSCIITNEIADGCAPLVARPECSLREEKVDGVVTYRNSQPTGLSPLPTTQRLTQGGCAESITQDWWHKERTYLCQGRANFDFTDAKRRLAVVNTSMDAASPTAGSVHYTDLRKDPGTGVWTTDTHTLQWNVPPASAGCQQVCKTRKIVNSADVNASGPVTGERASATQYEFFYKECTGGVSCPTEPGEAIIKSCQCLNEFVDAASAMSALNEAAKDIICTSGARQ